jgi:hypothetical protein
VAAAAGGDGVVGLRWRSGRTDGVFTLGVSVTRRCINRRAEREWVSQVRRWSMSCATVAPPPFDTARSCSG